MIAAAGAEAALDGPAADTDPNIAYQWGYGLSGDAATYTRLEKITLPGGRQVYYNYEDANAFMSLGRVANIAANGSPDDANTYVAYKYLGASTVVDANHPAGPAPLGPTGLRLTLDPNADKAYAGFDRLGRVIDQRWARSNSADPNADRFGYTYDRASNRLTRSLALKAAYNETYHYDFLDRLKDANRPGDSGMGSLDQSWTLRPTGNWSSFISAGVEQTREHNKANEILTITRDPIDPPDPLYDPAGSNVFGPKPNDDANGMHCRYDAWNRLASVHLDDGDTPGTLDGSNTLLATYRYDGLNRRVKKVVNVDGNSVTQHMYFNEGLGLRSLGEAGWQIVEVQRAVNADPAAAAAYKQYAWDLRYIDAPVCRWWDGDRDGQMEPAAGEMQYFTNDGNFNTTALIDANSGGVVERYQYDPYGKVTVLNGASGAEKDPNVSEWSPDADNKSDWDNDVLFCGYQYDPVTGLYQVRNRYYDPATGTWKTRDKSGYVDGVNLFEYGRCNPVRYLDPFGREIMTDCDISQYLKDNGVTIADMDYPYYFAGREDPVYRYYGAAKNGGSLTSQILGGMIRTKSPLSVKGTGYADEVANLKLHIAVRSAIVEKAIAAKFLFPAPGEKTTFREGHWKVTDGGAVVPSGSANTAVADIFETPGGYSMGCRDGAAAVVTAGVGSVFQKEAYDKEIKEGVGPGPATLSRQAFQLVGREDGITDTEDWIPGDWGYVPNPVSGRKDPYQGLHVIYLGLSLKGSSKVFWGHGVGQKTWESLQEAMAELPWNSVGDTTPKAVKADTYRDRPYAGLDRADSPNASK